MEASRTQSHCTSALEKQQKVMLECERCQPHSPSTCANMPATHMPMDAKGRRAAGLSGIPRGLSLAVISTRGVNALLGGFLGSQESGAAADGESPGSDPSPWTGSPSSALSSKWPSPPPLRQTPWQPAAPPHCMDHPVSAPAGQNHVHLLAPPERWGPRVGHGNSGWNCEKMPWWSHSSEGRQQPLSGMPPCSDGACGSAYPGQSRCACSVPAPAPPLSTGPW